MDEMEYELVAHPFEAGESFDQRLANTKEKHEALGCAFVSVLPSAWNMPGMVLIRQPRQ